MKNIYSIALMALLVNASVYCEYQSFTSSFEESSSSSNNGSGKYLYRRAYQVEDESGLVETELSLFEDDNAVTIRWKNLPVLFHPYGQTIMIVVRDNGKNIEIRDGMIGLVNKSVQNGTIIPQARTSYFRDGVKEDVLVLPKKAGMAVPESGDWPYLQSHASQKGDLVGTMGDELPFEQEQVAESEENDTDYGDFYKDMYGEDFYTDEDENDYDSYID